MTGRGPSLKNTRFIKRGLTQAEAAIVSIELELAKSRWDYLF